MSATTTTTRICDLCGQMAEAALTVNAGQAIAAERVGGPPFHWHPRGRLIQISLRVQADVCAPCQARPIGDLAAALRRIRDARQAEADKRLPAKVAQERDNQERERQERERYQEREREVLPASDLPV